MIASARRSRSCRSGSATEVWCRTCSCLIGRLHPFIVRETPENGETGLSLHVPLQLLHLCTNHQVNRFVGCDCHIEETFRDCKGQRWGLGLQYARSRDPQRWEILLLIGTLATVIHWLVGLAASARHYARHFQANTLKKRAVLSICFLGQQLLHNRRFHLTQAELLATAQRIPALCLEQTQWV
jgi:hypothetical protein